MDNLQQILTALIQEIDTLVEAKVNLKIEEIKKGYAKKQQPLMNVQEAAVYLNLSVKTVYRYVHLNKLSHFKPGNINSKNGMTSGKNCRLFFQKAELDKYLLNETNHFYSDDEIEHQADTRIARSKFL